LTWDTSTSIIRLIDRTNSTPTGITEGGLVGGTLIDTPYLARLTREKGEGKSPNATLMLYPQASGIFVRTAPILIDEDAPDKYLLEVRIDQNGKTGELQRYRLSTPTWTEDEDLGEVLSIPCESIAHEAIMESLISINDELVTPQQRVINLLTAWNGDNGADGVTLTYDTADIDIPTTDILKFDYSPTTPTSLFNLLLDVKTRLREAGPLGGVFKNYYWTTEADATNTNLVKFKMEEFGNDDSGVTIDPDNTIDGAPVNKALMSSNKKRRHNIVVKFNPKSGTLPREHGVFASNFLHASNRTEWSSIVTYAAGDKVKQTQSVSGRTEDSIRFFSSIGSGNLNNNPDSGSGWLEDFTVTPPWNADGFYTIGEIVTRDVAATITHYRATSDVGPSATAPESDGANWSTVMTARLSANFTPFLSPSPYTSDFQAAKQSLAAVDSPPSGYIGLMPDWNFARILNDIPDHTNRFKIVTGKFVVRQTNTPPTGRELHDGRRFLVGTSPTGDFAGESNKVAEYVRNVQKGISAHWEFSDAPVNGDTITNMETGEIWRYNSGWTVAWTVATNNDKPTCFHIVKSGRLVKDSSGIPGHAVEYRYNWKDALAGQDDQNRSSRGAWYGEFFPIPYNDASTVNLGGLYGGDGTSFPGNPYLNHINLNQAPNGLTGWNRGSISENQGRISEHKFKINLGIWRTTDETAKSKGKANIPMVYARLDNNGRWFFQDYTIPENSQWHPMSIRLPPVGPTNLYFNRLDELAEVLGYTIPFDFFIPEKEFTGVRYEWKRNNFWCTFMKQTYNNTGMYMGNYRNVVDSFVEAGTQVFGDILEFVDAVFTGGDTSTFTSVTSTIDHTTIAVCQQHYVKEGYAIWPQTVQASPRFKLIHLEQETDYNTALAKAESEYVESNFFPNERHVGITGDADIRYGQLITETGDRVTGGTLESVCANNKEIIDNKGYNQELYLVRKYVV